MISVSVGPSTQEIHRTRTSMETTMNSLQLWITLLVLVINHDRNLITSSACMLWCPAIVAGNVTLTYHGSQTPLISKSTVNPASTNASVPSSSSSLRVTLTRVHGVLMVVAWPVLAVIGIFFAAWMKPVLPNGRWFQVRQMYSDILHHSPLSFNHTSLL